MSDKLNINNEELRSLVLDCLKKCKTTQFVAFNNRIYDMALEKKIIVKQHSNTIYLGGSGSLSKEDIVRVQNILWDLIIEGIIRPGVGDGTNNDLPFLHVTEKGKSILEDDNVTPYDPDSYLKNLYKEIPNIDSVIITYLTESLSTFRIGCFLSSTIALGCASEKAFILLINSFINSIKNEDTKNRFTKAVEGKVIKRQFDEFMKYYNSSFKGKLDGDLKEGFEITILGVFEMIRINRNDAGHPTGKEIDREQLYANIIVFRTYLKKVYFLINWLEENEI